MYAVSTDLDEASTRQDWTTSWIFGGQGKNVRSANVSWAENSFPAAHNSLNQLGVRDFKMNSWIYAIP